MENKNLNRSGNLNLIQLLLSGGALFSMHFGASSMVWPMNWGKESGTSVFEAFLGAFITSVFLVLLGYIALARGKGSYNELANRILGKRVGQIYTSLTIAVLGPLYVIPRMSAAAWDSLAQAFGFPSGNRLLLIIFNILFYALFYYFLMDPGKAMDKISRYLFPFLLTIVGIIIITSLINPIGEPQAKSYEGSAFAYGFTNGYATAEILCALVYGAVIVNNLNNKGVEENKMTKNMLRIGLVGISLLSITHLSHMVIGSYTGDTFAHLNYTALYTAVVKTHFGSIGGIVFSIALLFAAMTAGIGMTSGCAEFFVEISNKRINYKQCAKAILLLSIVISSLGLTSILSLLGPILDGVYPAAIILVVYYALAKSPFSERWLASCRLAMYAAFFFGALDVLYKYAKAFGVNPLGMVKGYEALPLASLSLVWLPAALLAFLLGSALYRKGEIISP